RTGLSRKALRLYETAGILPRPTRTPAGYRVYAPEDLGVLQFVTSAQRLGFTLAEIKEVVASRRAGTLPCPHVRGLIEHKAAELRRMLAALRGVLARWDTNPAVRAAICPHIEGKGGGVPWRRPSSRSARPARPARRSSSTATPSASAKTRTRSSSRRRNGTSSSTPSNPASSAGSSRPGG